MEKGINKKEKINIINKIRKRALPYVFLCASCLLCMLALYACGKEKQEGQYGYKIYYVNREGTHVVAEEYATDTSAEDMDKLLPELLGQLADSTEKPECVAPLGSSFHTYTLNEGQINLDFNEAYRSQEPIFEILSRAAVVRTLTQVSGIDTVTFSVLGEALTDSMGIPVGAMAADSFIDNAGTEINAYAEAEFHLYFANQSGDGLVEVVRNVVYNSNISMEKQVMEELLRGPIKGEQNRNEDGYPTINPAAAALSVTAKDGVCYVNLSKEFLTPVQKVRPEVALYSIVNSLIELPSVNKVQLAVDGETDVMYADGVSLTTIFERNLDIVEDK